MDDKTEGKAIRSAYMQGLCVATMKERGYLRSFNHFTRYFSDQWGYYQLIRLSWTGSRWCLTVRIWNIDGSDEKSIRSQLLIEKAKALSSGRYQKAEEYLRKLNEFIRRENENLREGRKMLNFLQENDWHDEEICLTKAFR